MSITRPIRRANRTPQTTVTVDGEREGGTEFNEFDCDRAQTDQQRRKRQEDGKEQNPTPGHNRRGAGFLVYQRNPKSPPHPCFSPLSLIELCIRHQFGPTQGPPRKRAPPEGAA